MALVSFEKQFSYPLSPTLKFSISHEPDYMRFLRSMGRPRLYVAEQRGEVLGVLATVTRYVDTLKNTPLWYFCDMKIAPRHRGGWVLAKLLRTAQDHAIAQGITAAYGIAMAGSPSPLHYTGRLGLPVFEPLQEIHILRFATDAAPFSVSPLPALPLTWPIHRFTTPHAQLASVFPPLHISLDPRTSGILLDTLAAKRLWTDDGEELRSAHLSKPQAPDLHHLAQLIQVALTESNHRNLPGLFVALPPAIAQLLKTHWPQNCEMTVSSATLYGTGFPSGDWLVNTAEI